MTTEKGGRPRALTLAEIRQQQPPAPNIKEVSDTPGNNLKELKRLYRLRCRSSSCSHNGNGRGRGLPGMRLLPKESVGIE